MCFSMGTGFQTWVFENKSVLNSLDRRPRVNAFTATATDRVKKDIIKLLELNKPYMVKLILTDLISILLWKLLKVGKRLFWVL